MPTYDGIGQCAAAEGVDKKILKRAKQLGIPGFKNSKVYYDGELKKWVEQHKNDATVVAEVDNLAHVKLENLKKDGILKDLMIRQKEESLITIEQCEDLLKSIATMQIGILNRLSKELPLKISGKDAGYIEAELNKAFGELIDAFQADLDKLANSDE